MSDVRQKSAVLTVRLTPDELDIIHKAASESGLTLSAFIRGAALAPLGFTGYCDLCHLGIYDDNYRTVWDERETWTGEKQSRKRLAHDECVKKVQS